MKLLLATTVAFVAFVSAPARADDDAVVARRDSPAASVRTAANIELPAGLSGTAITVKRIHRRNNMVATRRRLQVIAPNRLVRVAYRPPAEIVCAGGACRPPIVLFLGITY